MTSPSGSVRTWPEWDQSRGCTPFWCRLLFKQGRNFVPCSCPPSPPPFPPHQLYAVDTSVCMCACDISRDARHSEVCVKLVCSAACLARTQLHTQLGEATHPGDCYVNAMKPCIRQVHACVPHTAVPCILHCTYLLACNRVCWVHSTWLSCRLQRIRQPSSRCRK